MDSESQSFKSQGSESKHGDDSELIPAATVLLLRDSDDGLEVLMLRRNSKIAFGGMWVFPGGRVDDHELDMSDPMGSARVAAVREVEEETGLEIVGSDLLTWSYWIPPPMPSMTNMKGPRRRFSTWFFATPAPSGEVAIDHGEIHEHRWLSTEAAFRQHAAGEIEIVPPTWITLKQISAHNTVAEAMAWASSSEAREFRTKPLAKNPMILGWAGDSAYEDGDVAKEGPRHRLTMHDEGWSYELSPA